MKTSIKVTVIDTDKQIFVYKEGSYYIDCDKTYNKYLPSQLRLE